MKTWNGVAASLVLLLAMILTTQPPIDPGYVLVSDESLFDPLLSEETGGE